MSASDAEAAAELKLLTDSLGIIFIGFAIATALYGVTCLQTYLYYRTYWADKMYLKITVVILWVLDTLSTILPAHGVYTFLITNFANPEADTALTWSLDLSDAVTGITTFLVQLYFAERLWRLSRNYYLVGIIALTSTAAFGLEMQTAAGLFQDSDFAHLSTRKTIIIGGITQGLDALCDIIITVGLCYFLHRSRTGVKRTELMIDKLIIYAINRGSLTAICQIMFLILNLAFPNNVYWSPFQQALGKLYVNSVLATLNVRHNINERVPGDIGGSESTGGSDFNLKTLNRLNTSTTLRPTHSVGSLGTKGDHSAPVAISVSNTVIRDDGKGSYLGDQA